MRLLLKVPAAPFKALAPGVLLLLGCMTLGGCVDVAGDPPSADAPGPEFVRRDDANMAGATLAIVSVEGAPAELSARFSQSLADAAAARNIAVAPPAKARYLVRGYLTASLMEGGAEVDFVWDMFTPDKQRVQRLSDAIAVKVQATTPGRWSAMRRSTASPPNAPTISPPISPTLRKPRPPPPP